MNTLGINAAFHDSAACLVRDGEVVAAAEEERFTRIKHGKRPVPFSTWELPFHAISYCLEAGGIRLGEIDHVAYSFDPHLILGTRSEQETITLPLEPSAHPAGEWESVWDPLFLSHIVNAPRHLAGGAPHHLRERLSAAPGGNWKWHFVPHHLAHAASAFLPSGFEEAAVLTLDGRGEKATTTYSVGRGVNLTLIGQVEMPHSLGILYEKVTEHLGFLHSSDEYKVMALASYGRPEYESEFREIVRTGDDGQYRIGPLLLEERFGPPRRRGAQLEQRHFDLARSLQAALEETGLALARWLRRTTGSRRLAMAGGVALNCVFNSRLRDCGPFDQVWVQPAAGDAGTALGVALWIDARQRGIASPGWRMENACLGPEYGEDVIEELLRWSRVKYRRAKDVASETAGLLARGKIIGWFQGRMEFGPRALGNRSILGSPADERMKDRMNEIKDREDFRPVAPVVLEEKAHEWFENATSSPFMLFVNAVRPEQAARIPAVRHVDGTARLQTIRREQNPLYYDLVREFEARTGVPVLINTSFNTRGQPIVQSPRDALESFFVTPLEALAIGPFLLEKNA